MKLEFVKNKPLFVLICVGLIVLLVLLSVWKQTSSEGIQEGMIMMDFTTVSNPDPNAKQALTDMDLQGYINALIPFEQNFSTGKVENTIKPYKEGYVYDPSGNLTGDVNLEGITEPVLEKFIKHLEATSKGFQNFADSLTKMKEKAKNDYFIAEQNRISAQQTLTNRF